MYRSTPSAYFPSSGDGEDQSVARTLPDLPARNDDFASRIKRNNDGRGPVSLLESAVVPVEDGGIHFPKNTNILWDRTGIAAPLYLSSSQIIPSLVLARADIVNLLAITTHHVHGSYDLTGSIHPIFHLNDEYQAAIYAHPGMHSSKYFLLLGKATDALESALTIPVLCTAADEPVVPASSHSHSLE